MSTSQLHAAHVLHADTPAVHGSLRSYIFGLILSIAMTVIMMVALALASIYAPDVVEFERLSAGVLLLTGAFMADSPAE